MNDQTVQQPQQPGTNWIGGAFNSMIISVESWLHTGFGVRYSGAKTVFAVLIMICFMLLYPNDDPGPMSTFIFWFILIRLAGRIDRLIGKWRGKPLEHSLYTGRPILLNILPFLGEQNIKRVEPILVVLFGLVVATDNRPLGIYLTISGLLLLFRNLMISDSIREQQLDMNDALIEQELLSERLRKTRR